MPNQPSAVQKDSLVKFEYQLTSDSGELLECSSEQGPLEYVHGYGNIIAGLEEALEGAVEEQTLEVRIAPEKAYGKVHDELIQKVSIAVFDGVDSIEPGMQFEAALQNGQMRKVVVKEVTGDNVLVDGNHRFAGKYLNFKIKILGVRPGDTN